LSIRKLCVLAPIVLLTEISASASCARFQGAGRPDGSLEHIQLGRLRDDALAGCRMVVVGDRVIVAVPCRQRRRLGRLVEHERFHFGGFIVVRRHFAIRRRIPLGCLSRDKIERGQVSAFETTG